MSELIFCCSGLKGCGKLYLGSHPERCDCGNYQFRQGIENLGYEARKELAELRRRQDNESVKRQYHLKPKKGGS